MITALYAGLILLFEECTNNKIALVLWIPH